MKKENSLTSNVKQSPDHVSHNIVTTLTELSLLRNTEREYERTCGNKTCPIALKM